MSAFLKKQVVNIEEFPNHEDGVYVKASEHYKQMDSTLRA